VARAGLDTAAVVRAGAEFADRTGLEALTLRGLAAELGVQAPSLYEHVASLQDLRRRIGIVGAQGLTGAMIEATGAGELSGGEALAALAYAHRSYARQHPGTYAAAQRARELAQDQEAIAAANAAIVPVMAVLRDYGLEGDEAIHAARVIRAALHGHVVLEAEQGFAINLSLDDTFERLIAVLDRGLGTSRATGRGAPGDQS
jgi:AcrR family transcriptional regulator